MDIDKLRQVLVDNKILMEDKSKNYICKCCYCGDHPNPKKQGHLYVSKRSEKPLYHCFYCSAAGPLPKLVIDITGNKDILDEIFTQDELNQIQQVKKVPSTKNRFRALKIPQLDISAFPNKSLYFKRRVSTNLDVEKVPNVIFDFLQFIHINNLDIIGKDKQISDFEADMIHKNFVCFLGQHNCIMYCRNIDGQSNYKFKKILLQEDSFEMLDYWCLPGNDAASNTVVLAEGNFNILCEKHFNSLNISDGIKLYASGNSFSYASLLKSICYDYSIYKCNAIILGDNDKKLWAYTKFLEESDHIISTCKIYINKTGKDFGERPINPALIN